MNPLVEGIRAIMPPIMPLDDLHSDARRALGLTNHVETPIASRKHALTSIEWLCDLARSAVNAVTLKVIVF